MAETEFVLVPKEPTPEMLRAAVRSREGPAVYKVMSDGGLRALENDARDDFRAMIAAAPAQAAPDKRARSKIGTSALAWGVSRMGDNPRAVLVSFRSEPTDDDLRLLHDALRPDERLVVRALAPQAAPAPQPEAAEPVQSNQIGSNQATLNAWFLSLPEGRQKVLTEDKWMLANAAFDAGQSRPAPPVQPPYPEGDVAGPCVCGSWPGGKCLRCPWRSARPTDDDLWDQTLRERDNYQEWADKLAAAIGAHFGADIGEHSNVNNPWAEALSIIESATPPAAHAVEAEQQSVEMDALIWRKAVQEAYGWLWHVNNEPMAPVPTWSPEKAAYEARKCLRELLKMNERGEAINAVRGMLENMAAALAPKEQQP